MSGSSFWLNSMIIGMEQPGKIDHCSQLPHEQIFFSTNLSEQQQQQQHASQVSSRPPLAETAELCTPLSISVRKPHAEEIQLQQKKYRVVKCPSVSLFSLSFVLHVRTTPHENRKWSYQAQATRRSSLSCPGLLFALFHFPFAHTACEWNSILNNDLQWSLWNVLVMILPSFKHGYFRNNTRNIRTHWYFLIFPEWPLW